MWVCLPITRRFLIIASGSNQNECLGRGRERCSKTGILDLEITFFGYKIGQPILKGIPLCGISCKLPFFRPNTLMSSSTLSLHGSVFKIGHYSCLFVFKTSGEVGPPFHSGNEKEEIGDKVVSLWWWRQLPKAFLPVPFGTGAQSGQTGRAFRASCCLLTMTGLGKDTALLHTVPKGLESGKGKLQDKVRDCSATYPGVGEVDELCISCSAS